MQPRKASSGAPEWLLWPGERRERYHLTWRGVQGWGCRRRQLRSAPGIQGVPGGDQPQRGEKLVCLGFAALRPEPVSRQRQCREHGWGTRSQPPAGGALEIRFALPTRPLSGAKARGWVLDLDLQVRTVSGNLIETDFRSCWDQKLYSWEEADLGTAGKQER